MVKAKASVEGRRFLLKHESRGVKKEGKWYPTEDVKAPAKRAFKPAAAKLRSNIVPGTVLILLAGRFKGKRVVFLKQLESGLLLVSGPYNVNGVPLRRVNQAYVIATSTKVDVSKVDVSAVTDAFLAGKEDKKKKAATFKASEKGFFEAAKESKSEVSEERKAVQAKVDAAISLDATQTAYLKSRFALTKGQAPHAMKF